MVGQHKEQINKTRYLSKHISGIYTQYCKSSISIRKWTEAVIWRFPFENSKISLSSCVNCFVKGHPNGRHSLVIGGNINFIDNNNLLCGLTQIDKGNRKLKTSVKMCYR